jgi:hypothetical protein
MHWLNVLRALPASRRAVQHQPETPRYARARTKLRYVLERGTFLGVRQSELHRGAVEVALWAPPGHGRGPGYYCCFRIFHARRKEQFAVLFCFYDGTEGSPGFKSVGSARTFASAHGFGGTSHEDNH